MKLLLKWFFNAGALLLVAGVLPGFVIEGFYTALIVALILGVLNTFVKPVLTLLTLPINLMTLGLFSFVVSGVLIYFVNTFVEGFTVDLITAIIAAVILSVISWMLNLLFRD